MDALIAIEEALRRLRSAARILPAQTVPLDEAFLRVLANDVHALLDVPHYDRAMLDGYAVKVEDIAHATREQPVELKVIATVGAGKMPEVRVTQGTAVRTMTGAPIAHGADAIVRFEYTKEVARGGERMVQVLRVVPKSEAIQEQGHDIGAGELLLAAGTELGAIEIAVLAAQGYDSVQVIQKPRVAIVATGSEVTPLGQMLQPGQLYNSNTPLIRALVTKAGGTAVVFPPVGDEPEKLKERLQEALTVCDILVTTGGVSVGDYDLTPMVLEQLGVKRLFWGVWMRPGTPVYAGTYEDRVVLSLSGNPAAAFVNSLVLLMPLLKMAVGQKDVLPTVKARLKNPPHKRQVKHTRFFAGNLVYLDNEWWIDVSGEHSSGVMTNFIGKTALARLDAEDELVEGTLVSVILL
ncbi:gephyrin-like molybdotransferase Glp [Sulfoacidibacillus thermotolerans]|uniref:Molybdopterin molybdenumtransferase n=1 Tax=Sulfoacidibacillus thermotolerans TaxID=1765684 RepID=A0A2U3D6G8_SULT2|nr:gephyrin-like molybdotransferase Glp [Sulfoacidibacillus thermotolerans]PWI56876.1 hypothetical protein BM613_11620 [Sulfoacidibacillus thermotolerans]